MIEYRHSARPPAASGIATPLAELHCHLEGAVPPALALRLAWRHGIDLSHVIDAEREDYRWTDFSGFLATYVAMCEAIRTPEDYHEITYDYFTRMAAKGLVYGEVFVSPDLGWAHRIPYPALIDAIAAGMRDAERAAGVVGRIIVIAIRHFGPGAAERAARAAERHPHPFVVGFGMAGEEDFGEPIDFRPAFEIARGSGLRLTAHAGEHRGPAHVRATVRDLGVERIGHGVRAIEDASVLAELRERGVTLEVCPGSNLALGLYPSLAAHPVKRLMQAGLRVTLNSDDPPFFATDVAAEYANVAATHGLGRNDLLCITRTALEAAFCDEETKERLLKRIEAAARGCPDDPDPS